MSEACQPIRDMIQESEDNIRSMEEVIANHEVPPFMLPIFKEMLKREKQHLKRLKAALQACLRAGKAAGRG